MNRETQAQVSQLNSGQVRRLLAVAHHKNIDVFRGTERPCRRSEQEPESRSVCLHAFCDLTQAFDYPAQRVSPSVLAPMLSPILTQGRKACFTHNESATHMSC